MAYDEGLAERVRSLLEDERGISEKRMFGGLVFLVDEKMFVGVKTELLVRVGKAGQAAALKSPRVRAMVMGTRTAQGFVYVDPVAVDREADLEGWVRPALALARSLPAKKATTPVRNKPAQPVRNKPAQPVRNKPAQPVKKSR